MKRDVFLWENWELVDELLEKALELEPTERRRFLADATRGRADLMAVLQDLIEASERSESGLEAARDALMGAALSESVEEVGGLDAGDPVGRYRIVREIARGGMATVYEAERADGTFAQRVAVKILRRGLDTEDVVRRFHAEREILSSLVHPNIATILDGGSTDDGRPYLVMELVDGQPLIEWARSRDLDVRRRLSLFLQVAEAVRFAHGQLVIHRDIKPSNVLVDAGGHVRLLDFGIAQLITPDGDRTRHTSLVPLTPAYASPEQARGERMSTVSDVFQLGALLFELVTDTRLPSPTLPPPPSALRGDLDTIVRKALREEPGARYASVEALIGDVQNYLEGRPIAARPTSLGYRLRKLTKRNPWLVPTAALVVALTGGYVVMLTLQANRLEEERDRARDLAERAGALRSLLVGQFDAASPWGRDPESARAVTVVEALDRAAEQARAELAGQPLVLAGILSDVAAIHEDLDLQSSAVDLLREAMALRERAGAGRSYDQLDDMGQLSELVALAHPDSARALAERRLELEGGLPDPNAERMGVALGRVARVEVAAGRYDRADSLFAESIALLRAADVEPAVLARHLETRALALRSVGELDEAERSVREALEIRRRVVADDHPTIAVAEEHLAQVLYSAGRLEEAADLYRAALAKMEPSLGPDHSTTLATLNNLALVLGSLEDFEGAAEVQRSLLDRRWERAGARGDSDVATSMQNLAATLVRQGSLDEADSLAALAGSMFSITNGPTHYTVGFALLTRAEIALLRGEGRGGAELAEAAGEVLRAGLPAGHYATAVADCRRAAGWAIEGRAGAAESLARGALESLRASAIAPDRFVRECAAIANGATERGRASVP
ncbi:MAG: serine/threonine-protein kinase [Gemmatimonadota bacterium]